MPAAHVDGPRRPVSPPPPWGGDSVGFSRRRRRLTVLGEADQAAQGGLLIEENEEHDDHDERNPIADDANQAGAVGEEDGVLGCAFSGIWTTRTAALIDAEMRKIEKRSGFKSLSLDLSKIEAGKLTLEEIDLSLADVIRQAIDLVTPRAREKGLSLSVELRRKEQKWAA